MGDYINRKELINDIKNNLWDWATIDDITASTVLKQTITDIKNQPSADVAEVKHGHWIFIGTISDGENEHEVFRCSDCMIPNNETSRFCPNCGAKMDE